MDKKTLLLFVFLIIPGLLMLSTFFLPSFSNVQPTVWFTTFTARVIFTIFCLSASLIAFLAIVFKKYSTVDSIQDHRDKVDIDKITDFIDNYISESHTTSDKESINEWVIKNYKK